MDALFDEEAGLLWNVRRDAHLVRESVWYALGLLERAQGYDIERAQECIRGAMSFQYVEPEAPFHGTFRRAPEEDTPPSDPVMWVHYDPNWRQFIGCTLAVILDRHSSKLDEALQGRMRASIELAVTGEDPERVAGSYANIALMKVWLDNWAGNDDSSLALATDVAGEFWRNRAFLEYNSPTYYGIDLWALGLWRQASGKLAILSGAIEEALWDDIAAFYHADLRNMCGPYDRSYGMDMTLHATPLGLWIWKESQGPNIPFPDPAKRFRHPHDFCFAPCVATGTTAIGSDARRSLGSFTGERTISRQISEEPSRVVTAWLARSEMFGGWDGPTSGIGYLQHQHATAHWRTESGVDWLRLLPATRGRAQVTSEAQVGRLMVEALDGELTFEASAPILEESNAWRIGDRSLRVDTTARDVALDGNRAVLMPGSSSTQPIKVEFSSTGWG